MISINILELEEQQKKAAAEAEAAAIAAAAATTPATPASAPTSVPAATATSQALPEYARGLNNYVMPSTPAASVPSPATPATPLRDSGDYILVFYVLCDFYFSTNIFYFFQWLLLSPRVLLKLHHQYHLQKLHI